MIHPGYRPSPGPDPGVRAEASQASRAVNELEARVDKLAMLCCAMWTVIQANSNVEDDVLTGLVRELDLADGRLDGKAQHVQVTACSKCDRPVALRQAKCMYCGAPRKRTHPFEDVL